MAKDALGRVHRSPSTWSADDGDPGSFPHRVIIEQRVNPARRNDLKEEIVEWEEFFPPPAIVWAKVEVGAGREFWQANQTMAALTHTVTIRYREGISTHLRLKWQGRPLNIEAVLDTTGMKEFLKLGCVEQFEGQQARGY